MLPRLTVLPFLLIALGSVGSLVLLPGAPAHAGPGDLTAEIPMTAPWYDPPVLGADLPPPLAAQPGVLYINFDGGKMHGGCGNDPKGNCSWIMQDTVLPYSGDAGQRAAVVQFIRKDFEDFNIAVTDIRPGDNVDYDMEMVGDWDPAPQGGFAGVAPGIDCFNNDGGATSFTLDYTKSAGGIAKAVLQEAAHTWGLEHVDSKGDLLYPTTAGVSDPRFQDECSQIVVLNQANQTEPTNGECVAQHKQFCGSGNLQNSYQELLQIFGAPEPDLVAPLVSISNPTEGAEVSPSFDLTIHAQDEHSPQLLKLEIVGTGASDFSTDTHRASPADITFPIQGLPVGDYTVRVTVTDEDDNLATAQVSFTVVAPGPTTAGDDTGDTSASADTGDTGDAGTAGPADSGAEDDGAPTTSATEDSGAEATATATNPTTSPTAGDDAGDSSGEPMGEGSGDDGCSCSTDRERSGGALALLLPLALGLRRRRA